MGKLIGSEVFAVHHISGSVEAMQQIGELGLIAQGQNERQRYLLFRSDAIETLRRGDDGRQMTGESDRLSEDRRGREGEQTGKYSQPNATIEGPGYIEAPFE